MLGINSGRLGGDQAPSPTSWLAISIYNGHSLMGINLQGINANFVVRH